MKKLISAFLIYACLAMSMSPLVAQNVPSNYANAYNIDVKGKGAQGNVQAKGNGSMSIGSTTLSDTTNHLFVGADIGKSIAISLATYHAPTLPANCTQGGGVCTTAGFGILTTGGSLPAAVEIHLKLACTNSTGVNPGDESYELAKQTGSGTSTNQIVITPTISSVTPIACDNSGDHYMVWASADNTSDWTGKSSGYEVLAIGADGCGAGAPVTLGGGCTINSMPVFAPWAATTGYSTKGLVIDSNGNMEYATSTGTSGSTQPIWPTVAQNTVSDGTVTWKMLGPAVQQFGVRQHSSSYNTGFIIIDSNGNMEFAENTGVTGIVPPTWPVTKLGTVTDGTITWEMVGTKPSAWVNWAIGTITSVTSSSAVVVNFTFPSSGFTPTTALANNSYEWGDDDTTAIQTALNQLDAVKGGTVYFPPGAYWINQNGLSVGTGPAKSFVTLQGGGAAGSKLLGVPGNNNNCGVTDLVQVGNGSNPLLTAGVGSNIQTNAGIHISDICFRDGTVSNKVGGSAGGSLGSQALNLRNEARVILTDVACLDYMHGICYHFDAGQAGQWSQFDKFFNLQGVNMKYGVVFDDGRNSNVKLFGAEFIGSELGGGICFDLESGGALASQPGTNFGGGGNSRFFGFECNYVPLALNMIDNNVNEFHDFHAENTANLEPNMMGSNNQGTGVLLQGTVAGGGKCQGNKFWGGSLTGFHVSEQIGLSATSNNNCQQNVITMSTANDVTKRIDYSRYVTSGGTPLGGVDTIVDDDIQTYRQNIYGQKINDDHYASKWCSITQPVTYDDTCITNAMADIKSGNSGGGKVILDGTHNYQINNPIVIGDATNNQPIILEGRPDSQITINISNANVDAISICDGSGIVSDNGGPSNGAAKPFRIELLGTSTVRSVISNCSLTGGQDTAVIRGAEVVADAGAVAMNGIYYSGLGPGSSIEHSWINGFTQNGVLISAPYVTAGTPPTHGINLVDLNINNSVSANSVPLQLLAVSAGATTGTVNTSGTAVTLATGTAFNTYWTGSITINSVVFTIASVNSSSSITLTATAGTQTGVGYTYTVVNNGVSNISGIQLKLSGAGPSKCEMNITGNLGGYTSTITNHSMEFNNVDVEANASTNSGICVKDSHDIYLHTVFGGAVAGTDIISAASSTSAPQITTGSIYLTNVWSPSWTNSFHDLVNSKTYTEPHIFNFPFAGGNAPTDNIPPLYFFVNLPSGVSNGNFYWCPDCTANSSPCSGTGTGAFAFRENGAYQCK